MRARWGRTGRTPRLLTPEKRAVIEGRAQTWAVRSTWRAKYTDILDLLDHIAALEARLADIAKLAQVP